MKGLSLLVFAGLLGSGAAMAGELLVASTKKTTYWLSDDSVKLRNGKVTGWVLYDHFKPDEEGMLSARVLARVGCDEETYGWISGTMYDGPMGTGKVIGRVTLKEHEVEMEPVPPGSANDKLVKAMCHVHATGQFPEPALSTRNAADEVDAAEQAVRMAEEAREAEETKADAAAAIAEIQEQG